jgi:hypothetical protein
MTKAPHSAAKAIKKPSRFIAISSMKNEVAQSEPLQK